ncbi:MAG TPA: DeoR family transcriptional regulator [Oligoflexus sp.]|uniref:DeoR family transcriptional regulator n=1 Tax=Oligoflexus sp. TaxID=1971216 RepID=UPI002D2B88BE|nr:DeoR family transcriptional regulator [Oligoflexus sp.]HYX36389.1 DeoR family transcriptional regulator [Oligoflexus sp.]
MRAIYDMADHECERLLYQGRYNEILALSVDSPDFQPGPQNLPHVVAALALLGRTEEAGGLYHAYISTLPPKAALVTRFFYALAVCRERRMPAARSLFVENWKRARALVQELGKDGASIPEVERVKFYSAQGLAFLRYNMGHFRQSEFWIRKALNSATASSFQYGSCLAHELHGHIQLQVGQVTAGMINLKLARDKAARLGQGALTQTFDAAQRLYRATYGLCSHADEIIVELYEAISKCRYEDAYTKASLQIQLARILTLTGDLREASALLEKASSLVYKVDNPYLETIYNLCLAHVQMLEGNDAIALSIARNTEARARERSYMPSVLKSLGLQCAILERMGMGAEQKAVIRDMKSLTAKSGSFVSRRIQSRSEFMAANCRRGEDPLGDLLDDVYFNKRDIIADIFAKGWLSFLHQVLGVTPQQNLIVFDLQLGSITLFSRGHITHRAEGCTALIKKLLLALKDGRELSKEAITHFLWAQAYHPMRHDQLIYTLIARTRRLLQPYARWIEVTDHGYRLEEGVSLRNGRVVTQSGSREPDVPMAVSPAASVMKYSLPEPLEARAELPHLNARQIEILDMARDFEKIQPRQMAKRFKVSDATITRDLSRLVELGTLRRFGSGRSTYYQSQES